VLQFQKRSRDREEKSVYFMLNVFYFAWFDISSSVFVTDQVLYET
jgi:hypothetical protein